MDFSQIIFTIYGFDIILLSEFCSGAMSKQWLIDSTWKKVQDDFSLRNLFGDHGAAFLEAVGARRCIHPLAVAMSILGALAPLANGAGVRLWSDPSPLCVAIVLINAAQSRKSQTTILVREIGVILDEFGHAREREQMLKDLKTDADPNEVKYEVLPSAVLEGFTPEAGIITAARTSVAFSVCFCLHPPFYTYRW